MCVINKKRLVAIIAFSVIFGSFTVYLFLIKPNTTNQNKVLHNNKIEKKAEITEQTPSPTPPEIKSKGTLQKHKQAKKKSQPVDYKKEYKKLVQSMEKDLNNIYY